MHNTPEAQAVEFPPDSIIGMYVIPPKLPRAKAVVGFLEGQIGATSLADPSETVYGDPDNYVVCIGYVQIEGSPSLHDHIWVAKSAPGSKEWVTPILINTLRSQRAWGYKVDARRFMHFLTHRGFSGSEPIESYSDLITGFDGIDHTDSFASMQTISKKVVIPHVPQPYTPAKFPTF